MADPAHRPRSWRRAGAALARRIDHYVRTAADVRVGRALDKSLGISTTTRGRPSPEARRAATFADAKGYQGVPSRRFLNLLEAMPLDASQTTFIDLGCGKGRALVLAARFGFRRVIGVEFDPSLAKLAERNARSWSERSGSPVAIEVLCGDASEFEFPRQPSLVFMFNPFGEKVMGGVVANLERSLDGGEHDVAVLYLNPLAPMPWLSSPCFRPLPLPRHLETPGRPGLFRSLRHYEHGSDLSVLAVRTST